ncbi:flagellar hook-associated protein 3 [Clostridium botulinum]|uniref:Flagellar hook-associated protein 3 n=1 Tax=Clostridium botulinum TaxID=1491 RepID=A0A9Q1V141_CLOBO|nr:flagellar hook-associated protein FlgL [Clostridium botulinum]AEB75775.1 putative flagellar hook-associated protein 3 [Clostridium botulinum BKT015925]KEI05768.1 flagellar hook-associated protein 3 [Clostridium botulinum C/D str. Sp77]KOA76677.1 flagellar hook-associated protein 3 [Clostridium botulinum]KOA85337.1 flagellar hook-associated protein 3 [Clostridium botulinum]KOA86752.1 flagellar hook-associated protein 3 [Clostridium botulinum]
MRVTNKMLSNNFLADMKVNLENINKIQQQNTSGKKFRKPSDDPFAVARSMQLHTDINTNKQYSKNITDVSNWLDTTDTALGQAGNVFQRVRELLISAGNGGYTESERRAIKDEINEKVREISQILNTNFGGNYIFGGTRSTTKPIEVVGGSSLENSAMTKEIVIDNSKIPKAKTIINEKNELNGNIEIKIEFDNTKKVAGSTSDKKNIKIDIPAKTKIYSLSDLAEQINKQISDETKNPGKFGEKVKAIPNIKDNTIMFVNINKPVGEETKNTFTIQSSTLGINNTTATFNSNNTQNSRLMYNQKEGGELVDGPEYNQIKSRLKIEVSQGVAMDYNVSAADVIEFKNEKGDSIDLRKVLNSITNHLDDRDEKGTDIKNPNAIKDLLTKDLQDVTDTINNLLKIRAEVGAKQNRIEGANDRNKDGTFNMTKILSKHEDVNYTENMTDYATMLTVYMASLQTSAKIIQPSLMDYLR